MESLPQGKGDRVGGKQMTDKERIAEILLETWRAGNDSSFTPDDKDKPLEWLGKQADKILGYTRPANPSP